MWFGYILQEFFRKLKTHERFPKIHMFMASWNGKTEAVCKQLLLQSRNSCWILTMCPWNYQVCCSNAPQTGSGWHISSFGLRLKRIASLRVYQFSKENRQAKKIKYLYMLLPYSWRFFWALFLVDFSCIQKLQAPNFYPTTKQTSVFQLMHSLSFLLVCLKSWICWENHT